MGLTLQITPKNATTPLTMTLGFESNTNATITLSNTYTLSLDNLSFNKQMYQPGEINARIQISPSLDWSTLQDKFLDSKVSLFRGKDSSKKEIATDYYVHELTPEYSSSTTLYVNFKIFSPDKKLTLKSDCQVFVSKRLGEDILKTKSTDVTVNISLKNGLAYGNNQEYIQPYLVQYNESFYDMLVRTANRWGEFVYYEGGQLILGRVTSTNTELTKYVSASYVKTNGVSIDNNCSKAVTTDDYLAVIKRSHKPEYDKVRKDKKKQSGNEYILQAGDFYAFDAVYKHKLMQSLFNMKGNVFDWVLNTFVDDKITAAQNEHVLYHKEQKYNDEFFNTPLKEKSDGKNEFGELIDFVKLHYGEYDTNGNNPQSCRQFATYENDGGLTNANYRNILAKELLAGQETVCVDMDDDDKKYQHLLLGDVFYIGKDTEKYLVTRIECFVDDVEGLDTEDAEAVIGNQIKKVITSVKIKHTKQLRYRVYAIKQVNTGSKDAPVYAFYPPMLPSGHIRFSGPQRGIVKKTLDPMLNGRCRVQTFGTELSPWLRVSREMVKGDSGAVWQLEENTEVLLDFDDGNVELPYIVGALQNTEKRSNNRATMFNKMDMTTPAGHSIRLSDGAGGGAANFIASFIPLVSWIKGFHPGDTGLPDYGGYSKYYEGGMELTDKFGIYSIKASTDKRNISINSPYGTVNLNAFSGITISAPNGDVKIQGKNVSIEAGNKISITSGKNITNGLLGSGIVLGGERKLSGGAFGSDIANTIGKKVADWLDISIVRDVLEVFLRPISGTLEIKSMRAIQLQAGIEKDNMRIEKTTKNKARNWILSNYKFCDLLTNIANRLNSDKEHWRVPQYGTIQLRSVTTKADYINQGDVFGQVTGQVAEKGDAIPKASEFTTLQGNQQNLGMLLGYLSASLRNKADKTSVNALQTSLSHKADQTSVDNLQTSLNDKADQTSVEGLQTSLNNKADKTSVDEIKSALSELKASLPSYKKE